MATQYVYFVLLLWFSSFKFTSSVPAALKDHMNYDVIKTEKLATSEPSDVYAKSIDSGIPHLFHAIELKKKVYGKRQASNEKNVDTKSKQRTPLEKGLWGKRFVQQSSITNTVANDYNERLRRIQDDIDKDRAARILINKRRFMVPDVFESESTKKATEYNDQNKNNDFQSSQASNDMTSDSFGPIEKGLWGKRDEIDDDLDTVVYLRDPNDVFKVNDLGLSKDVYHTLGNSKRYFILRKLGNDEVDDRKEKRSNPVEKGLWGKRNVMGAREYNALYNSKMTNDVSSKYTNVEKDDSTLNSKPYKDDYEKIYVVS